MSNAADHPATTPEASPTESTGTVPKRDRRSIHRILPGSVIDELRRKVAVVGGSISAEFASALDHELQIHERFGVGRKRLRTFLQSLQTKARTTGKAVDSVSPEGAAVQDHRARQASAAAVIKKTFGPLAKSRPELWNKHAYLLLVGIIYERLSMDQAGIPTKELVSLAKILLDGRRNVACSEGQPDGDDGETVSAGKGPLPDRFADLVRQVYGTTLPESARPASP